MAWARIRSLLLVSAVFFAASFVLQLLVNLSVPFIGQLHLFHIASKSGAELRWGIWGSCARQSASSSWQCTHAALQYRSAKWGSLQNSLFASEPISGAFILQPISTGLAGACTLLTLWFLPLSKRKSGCWAKLVGYAAGGLPLAGLTLAAACLGLELYFFLQVKEQVQKGKVDQHAVKNVLGNGSGIFSISTYGLGPANWLQAAALASILVAYGVLIVAFIGSAKRKSLNLEDPPVVGLGTSTMSRFPPDDESGEERYFMHQTYSNSGFAPSAAAESQAALISNKSPDLRDPHDTGRFTSYSYFNPASPLGQDVPDDWYTPSEKNLYAPNPTPYARRDMSLAPPPSHLSTHRTPSSEGEIGTLVENGDPFLPYDGKQEFAFAYSPGGDSFSHEERKVSVDTPNEYRLPRSRVDRARVEPPYDRSTSAFRETSRGELPPSLAVARPPLKSSDAPPVSAPAGAGMASRLSARLSQAMFGSGGPAESVSGDTTMTSNSESNRSRRGLLRRSGSLRVHQAARASLMSRLSSEAPSNRRTKGNIRFDTSLTDDASEVPPDESVIGQHDIYGAPSEVGGYSVADYVGLSRSSTVGERQETPSSADVADRVSRPRRGRRPSAAEEESERYDMVRDHRRPRRRRSGEEEDGRPSSRSPRRRPPPKERAPPLPSSSAPSSILQSPQQYGGARITSGRPSAPRQPPTYEESEAKENDWNPSKSDHFDLLESVSCAETEDTDDSWALDTRSSATSRSRRGMPRQTQPQRRGNDTLKPPRLTKSSSSDEDEELEFIANDETMEEAPTRPGRREREPSTSLPKARVDDKTHRASPSELLRQRADTAIRKAAGIPPGTKPPSKQSDMYDGHMPENVSSQSRRQRR